MIQGFQISSYRGNDRPSARSSSRLAISQTMSVTIRTILPPPWQILGPLIARSCGEGFTFLSRMRIEYQSGAMRFDGEGEVLLGVFVGSHLVGVGGLSRDPYADSSDIGRVRHVYVMPECRRQGIGRALVKAIEQAAIGRFAKLRLRTDTAGGERFYERIGFDRTNELSATHYRALQQVA